jgi:hypothetical protein
VLLQSEKINLRPDEAYLNACKQQCEIATDAKGKREVGLEKRYRRQFEGGIVHPEMKKKKKILETIFNASRVILSLSSSSSSSKEITIKTNKNQ